MWTLGGDQPCLLYTSDVYKRQVEACPFDHKEKVMSLLHSFYCWGSVCVILLSTIFFSVFGIDKWRILAYLWAMIPLYNIYN